MSSIEQTLSIIKPDAVERNLDNKIKEMFIDKGFKIVKDKKIEIAKTEAEQFYKVHETKPFYNDLCAIVFRTDSCDGARERKCSFRKQRVDGCD